MCKGREDGLYEGQIRKRSYDRYNNCERPGINVKIIGECKSGKMEGPWKIYAYRRDILGELLSEEIYKDDKRFGTAKTYGLIKGNLVREEEYDKTGNVILSKTYDEAGTLVDCQKATNPFQCQDVESIKFCDDISDQWGQDYAEGLPQGGSGNRCEKMGDGVYEDHGGQEKILGRCQSGQPEGIWKFYDKKGVLRIEEFYPQGREEGISRVYHMAGYLLPGVVKTYDVSGRERVISGFNKHQEGDSFTQYFDSKGVLRLELYNTLMGRWCKIYRSNGKIEKEDMDSVKGVIISKLFDNSGKLVECRKATDNPGDSPPYLEMKTPSAQTGPVPVAASSDK